MNKHFALVGAAGFVAKRHLQAIKENGGKLLAAIDQNDNVGILDSFFPNTHFFVEIERFERHIQKLQFSKNKILDYISICSPNYLHDAHVRLALRNDAHAICEKPLVLNPWNADQLERLEEETGYRVWNILQLRLHPSILELKKKVASNKLKKKYEVDLSYITSRGNWYYTSWKGHIEKSGGIATNIGIHFFDMLIWIFGPVQENKIHIHTYDRAAGYLELENARVRWFLSINEKTLPKQALESGQRTFRSITIDNEEIEFSAGFTDLHTTSYQEILNGRGFGIEETRPAIDLAYNIRNQDAQGLTGDYHPFCELPFDPVHPFKKSHEA